MGAVQALVKAPQPRIASVPAPSPYAALLAGLPVREHALQVLGSTTKYWDYGPEDALTTVIVVHGYRGEHHGLEPVIAQLRGLRVISPDLPGFGVSTPMTQSPHSVEGYGRWFGAFSDALDLRGRAVVLGHSFGSIVTAHAVAAGYPAPALILVNPIASDPHRVSGFTISRLYYDAASRLPERLGHALLSSPIVVEFVSRSLVRTPDRELRRWIHAEHHRYFSAFSDVATVVQGYEASLHDIVDAAPRLRLPVLMIAGEVDRIAPVEGARAVAQTLPDGRLVVLPGVGHLIHYEAAEGAAEAIRAFLAELRP